PELLRKGRFDEIFFCDLPSAEERRQIFEIHLRKKHRDPTSFELDKLAAATTDFSGAEIEQAVVAALYDAFDASRDLATEGLLHSLGEIVPLAVTMREQIDGMREWARTRARMASGRRAEKKGSWIEKHGGSTGERKLEM
ncbi:MAG TPA: ATPase, partial [Kofleriaceae bacterium]